MCSLVDGVGTRNTTRIKTEVITIRDSTDRRPVF